MKNRSLKKQILQILLFFIISVILVIGILSIVNIYNSKIDLIRFNQISVLNQVDNKVNNIIKKISKLSGYISNKYFKKSKDISLNNILEIDSEISSILILNDKGILEDFYINSKFNQNIYKGFDYSNKEYYKGLENTNEYWSNVFLSSFKETPTISYSFRMKNKIGVILIDLKNISNFVLNFKNLDNSYMIRIFDRNGTLIINPSSMKYVLQRFNANSSEVYTKLINKLQPLDQTVFYSDLDAKELLGSYYKNKKTGWSIVVKESYSKFLKSLHSVIITYIFLIILFIVISIYLSIKISKVIFSSFDKIHDITSKIATGDYDIKVEKSPFKEFSKLLNSFQKMQKEIDKREDSLEKSLDSFKSLFNSTMECVILSKGHSIIDVNDVTLKLFEFKSKKDVIGKNVFDYIMDDYKDLVKENFKKNIDIPYEVEFVKDDGTIFCALVQGKFLELNGESIRVSALIDISDIKNKDKLLFQQSKMASMGEMIGNIAHQWRQPLNVISTSASSIKLGKEFGILEDGQLEKSMDMIVQNALYLSKTIDDFRNFFKKDKALESFEVKEIVEKALKLLQSSIKNHNIIVETHFLDKEFMVQGYPNEFIQVLINIINNSKDAFISNDCEQRVIKISEELLDDCYKLRIMDNAGGIPNNIIYNIFDPYFTTKHKSQGTGIGLYMSHQIIVDHMGGNLYVKNRNFNYEGVQYKGSYFTIKLPKKTFHNFIYEI